MKKVFYALAALIVLGGIAFALSNTDMLKGTFDFGVKGGPGIMEDGTSDGKVEPISSDTISMTLKNEEGDFISGLDESNFTYRTGSGGTTEFEGSDIFGGEENNAYIFNVEADETYMLIVRIPGYLQWNSTYLSSGDTNIIQIDFKYKIYPVDESGSTLSNVQVSAGESTANTACTSMDSGTYYTCFVDANSMTYQVEKTGYTTATGTLTATATTGAEETVTLTEANGGEIYLDVQDAEGNFISGLDESNFSVTTTYEDSTIVSVEEESNSYKVTVNEITDGYYFTIEAPGYLEHTESVALNVFGTDADNPAEIDLDFKYTIYPVDESGATVKNVTVYAGPTFAPAENYCDEMADGEYFACLVDYNEIGYKVEKVGYIDVLGTTTAGTATTSIEVVMVIDPADEGTAPTGDTYDSGDADDSEDSSPDTTTDTDTTESSIRYVCDSIDLTLGTTASGNTYTVAADATEPLDSIAIQVDVDLDAVESYTDPSPAPSEAFSWLPNWLTDAFAALNGSEDQDVHLATLDTGPGVMGGTINLPESATLVVTTDGTGTFSDDSTSSMASIQQTLLAGTASLEYSYNNGAVGDTITAYIQDQETACTASVTISQEKSLDLGTTTGTDSDSTPTSPIASGVSTDVTGTTGVDTELPAEATTPSATTPSTSTSSSTDSSSSSSSSSSTGVPQITVTPEQVSQVMRNVCTNHPFTDIIGHWGENAICRLYNAGIVSGYDNTSSFGPNNNITRAEWIKIIVRNAGYDEGDAFGKTEGFMDVSSSDWYYDYIVIAQDKDIVRTREGEYFNPNTPITRADAVLYQIRMANQQLWGWDNSDIPFSDITMNDYFAYAVIIANNTIVNMPEGGSSPVIEGYSNSEFKPYNYITRAEAASVATRAWLAWFSY